jgi:anti-sigma regulatory factor (Ser/Thr protein kinase)
MDKNSITVKAEISSLDDVLNFVSGACGGLSMKLQSQLEIAVEEIFVNIANYAYTKPANENIAGLPCGDTTITVNDRGDRIFVTFEDSGIPYNPLLKSDPDVTQSADVRDLGGLGIFMVKKLMDGMEYKYEDGKNILTIYKSIAV